MILGAGTVNIQKENSKGAGGSKSQMLTYLGKK